MFGGDEFIKGISRYCFWISDSDLEEANKSQELRERFEKVKANKRALFDIFFTNKKKEYWEKYHSLLSYFQLLSLLIHTDKDKYIGDSVVLLKKPQDIFYPIEQYHNVVEAFDNFKSTCGIIDKNRQETWNFYPDAEPFLLDAANMLDCVLSEKDSLIS